MKKDIHKLNSIQIFLLDYFGISDKINYSKRKNGQNKNLLAIPGQDCKEGVDGGHPDDAVHEYAVPVPWPGCD